jgi:O-acetylserine/cysteine efflux transporter
VAFIGLVVIADTAGEPDFSLSGLGLCLAAALCWAIGNVLLRGAGKLDMLPLVVWLSLIPPIPLFMLSFLLNGPATVGQALLTLNWSGVGAVLYISILSTILCFAIWGQLSKQYPASTVAPFSLLVPIFGAASAAIALGKRFGSARMIGVTLVLIGLIVVIIRLRRIGKKMFSPASKRIHHAICEKIKAPLIASFRHSRKRNSHVTSLDVDDLNDHIMSDIGLSSSRPHVNEANRYYDLDS